jgi:hypothetical protein
MVGTASIAEHPLHDRETSSVALVLVDVVNPMDFQGGEALLAAA